MLREFFCSGPLRRLAFAWAGLCVFMAHALFKAWLKWALNGWYADFYDELQDIGSGFDSDDPGHLAAKREAVFGQLVQFTIIVAPAVVVHPIAKWIASVWRFTWRMALVRSYLVHYDVTIPPVEGAAQRIHEDTSRFEEGIYSCCTIVLDSILTLAIFVPVLLEVGASAHPDGLDWPPWLLAFAMGSAFGGLGISMVVGRKLVWLEVLNQKVEAIFRTKLVLLEQSPASVVGGSPTNGAALAEELHFEEITRRPPPPRPVAPIYAFSSTISDLWENYRRLYLNFAAFNTWISLYDQCMVLAPFLVVAPLMFAENPENRITLGTLMKVTNAFDKVFSALAVVTENWASVNEFRSTMRRLREFEDATYKRKPFDHMLLRDETPAEIAPVFMESTVSVEMNGGRVASESGVVGVVDVDRL